MPAATTHLDDTVPRVRWTRIGLVLFIVYVTAFAERTNISVAAPSMQEDLGLSTATTGVMLSAFFWGYVLTQVPGGWLAHKIGPRALITGALTMWGVTALLTAAANSLSAVLAARFLMGLCEGVVWPAFAILFVKWYPTSERARAAGLSLLALPVSAAIMSPSAGWLIERFGWHEMFIFQGIPAFLFAVVAWWALRNSPEEDRRLSVAEREMILATRDVPSGTRASFMSVVRTPAVWVCALIYFLWLTGFYAFGLWLPTVLKDLSAAGIEATGWLAVVPFSIAGIAMLLNARASDRSTRSRSWFVVPPLVLGTVALVLQHFLPDELGIQMVLLVLTAIGVYAPFGPWWAWAFRYVPASQTGPASGFINVGGNFGGLAGPVIVAWAAGGGSTGEGFWALGISLALAALLAIGLAVSGGRSTVVDASGRVDGGGPASRPDQPRNPSPSPHQTQEYS